MDKLPDAPTKGWELGKLARATSTGEVGKVVEIRWNEVTILSGNRRLRFEVRFLEKIDE